MTLEQNRVVALVMKVQDAFLDTPALQLTLPDAERSFGTDRSTSEAVLRTLVNAGVLARTHGGAYVRFFPHRAHAA